MSVAAVLAQVELISPVDEREVASIAGLRQHLTQKDPYSETSSAHHVTASCFVVSGRGVILHLHRRLGIWVQPGGHIDEGEEPAAAALRECEEETGLRAAHCDPPYLFHVDAHPGPRGHTHYDLRYVLVADPEDPTPPAGESPEVFWFDFPEALERCEPALRAALAKLAVDPTVQSVRHWQS